MHALRTAVDIAWILFWVYWLVSAFAVKEGRGSRRRVPLNGLTALSVVLVVRVFRGGSLSVHSPVLGAIGAVVFAAGIAVAIRARVHLGRNWGMPMTQKAEPELVTSGPYRFVRHPVYSGLLAGVLRHGARDQSDRRDHRRHPGWVLLLLSVRGGEEPHHDIPHGIYPAYQATPKMLIPFVL